MATTPTFGWPTPDDTDLVRDGAAAIRDLGDAVDAYSSGGYLYAGTIYYTSSGSFLKADPFGTGDIGLRAIRVRMVGGGGGGGGANTTGANTVSVGGGGQGGGYAESFITDIAGLASSVTVTRGAGGGGGGAGAAGSAGGESSFDALVVASGGEGGQRTSTTLLPAVTTPVAGPTVFTGDVTSGQQSGERGIGFSTASGRQYGGAGGSSRFGAGAAPVNGDSSAGNAGTGFGAGGGGAVNNQNQTGVSGGAGTNGIVIVDCFV